MHQIWCNPTRRPRVLSHVRRIKRPFRKASLRDSRHSRFRQLRRNSPNLKFKKAVFSPDATIPHTRFHLKACSLPVRLVLCLAVLHAATLVAQTSAVASSAPIPRALRSAGKIFVSNAGADSGLFPSPFSGDPTRGYNQLYAALKADGKFQLVDDPAEADLVLELELTAPNGPSNGSKVNGASNPLPMLRLVIYDRKSHYVLWALTQSIDVAYLQKTHDRNFDQALEDLRLEFEALAGKADPAAHTGP